MIKSPLIRIGALSALFLSGTVFALAQGRGGGPTLSALQQAALGDMAVSADLSTAATSALNALTEASYALPANAGTLAARAQDLANAELALALARADGIAAVRDSLRISAAQAASFFGGRGGGGGGRGGAAQPDNYDGFVSLFDGETLAGWDGDPMFWSVQDGVIVAESTPEKVVQDNTFLIYRGQNIRDFELKVDYRFVGNGNSGIQIRSRMSGMGRGGGTRPWGISGYQMDMVTAGGTGSGVFFTEGGGFGLLGQGTAMRITEEGQQRLIGSLGIAVSDAINPGPEWNTYHIIAKGNVIAAFINGRMTAFLVDDDTDGTAHAEEGLLALQMHVGGPFRLEFKNIYLKEL